MESDLPEPREESEILQELEELCKSEGYALALAYLSEEANYIEIEKNVDYDKVYEQHWEAIMRSEVELLTGLMVKTEINNTLKMISSKKIKAYVKKSKYLLEELHTCLIYDFMNDENVNEVNKEIAKKLREAFFYGAETACDFQYHDFAIKNHTMNNCWFKKEKEIDIDDVSKIIMAINKIIFSKSWMLSEIKKYKTAPSSSSLPDNIKKKLQTQEIKNYLLYSVVINKQEIVDKTKLSNKVVSRVLDAFSILKTPCNKEFKMHGDFNKLSSHPIIKINNDQYMSFQAKYLMKSFYRSPYFWMLGTPHEVKGNENRGKFLEEVCTECLRRVFKDTNIYKNVLVLNAKGERAGEIDILACYADKAVIIEAKSKKMRLKSIRGNLDAIKIDFEKGISKAYNQAFRCGEFLLNVNYKFVDEQGNFLNINRSFSDIYLMCITSDTYPGLAHQVSLFLEKKEHDIIQPPYIADIFEFDALCEFLNNPIYFLNYQYKRALYFKDLLFDNELSVLGCYLLSDLYVPPDGKLYIIDAYINYIDVSFSARRKKTHGNKTPEGILKMHKGGAFDKMIKQFTNSEENGIIDFFNSLLDLSQEEISTFDIQYKKLIKRVKRDRSLHDFTIICDNIGITVYASLDSVPEIYENLVSHCEIRKYKERKNRWCGILLDVKSKNKPIKAFVALRKKWEKLETME